MVCTENLWKMKRFVRNYSEKKKIIIVKKFRFCIFLNENLSRLFSGNFLFWDLKVILILE